MRLGDTLSILPHQVDIVSILPHWGIVIQLPSDIHSVPLTAWSCSLPFSIPPQCSGHSLLRWVLEIGQGLVVQIPLPPKMGAFQSLFAYQWPDSKVG
jgi:hypothetical protein